MNKTVKAEIEQTGREYLADFLSKAEEHGTIYYTHSASRSGMGHTISLWTIVAPKGTRKDPSKAVLVRLWPAQSETKVSVEVSHTEALDIVAKDWGFCWKARAFKCSGGGMDMVFHLIDSLARRVGMPSNYSNKINRSSLG